MIQWLTTQCDNFEDSLYDLDVKEFGCRIRKKVFYGESKFKTESLVPNEPDLFKLIIFSDLWLGKA